MSSRRSRSGGSCDLDHVQAVEEVLAEAPRRAPPSSRSRLVAATMRTSTLHVARAADAPERRAPGARAAASPGAGAAARRSRRGTACRRRRPRTGPTCSPTAPVNAPFTWPNSSDSSRFSGIAPQLTATNGLSRRWLLSWIARATSSLPVPLSPRDQHVRRAVRDLRDQFEHRCIAAAVADDVLEAVLGLHAQLARRRWFSRDSCSSRAPSRRRAGSRRP